MAEDINIGSDSLLATDLAATDRVVITKEATGQQVGTMTVANLVAALKPMLGTNYTYTDEWAVPGEFWRDINGTAKQVYCKTFKGALPTWTTSNVSVTLLTGISDFSVVHGRLDSFPEYNNSSDYVYMAIQGAAIRRYGAMLQIIIVSTAPDLYKNKNFLFTIKYTKS